MTDAAGDLPEQMAAFVDREELLEPGDGVVVAVSGGIDSVVLLHLLRFHPPVEGLSLTVAHLDHAMRPGSRGDADWVRGLARAWEVGHREERLESGPGDEAEARHRRYHFLRRVAETTGARRVATAHHADDQAETVLFRAARGTGVDGLAGIEPLGRDGRIRPLLPFSRREIRRWARRHRLGWRTDPTNRTLTRPRSVLRHRVLPLLEEGVAPGVRRSLARLARNARRDREAWDWLLSRLLDPLIVESDDRGIVVDRDGLLAHPAPVRGRLLRALADRLGGTLDEAGTRLATEVSSSLASGREIHLRGGLVLRRDLDQLVLHAGADVPPPPPDREVVIDRPDGGSARLRLSGRSYRVAWGTECGPARWTHTFPLAMLTFPLHLRARRPGDRMRLHPGSRSLKALFLEARIPARHRASRPVLADGEGRILWVPGVAAAAATGESDSSPEDAEDAAFAIAVAHAGGSDAGA